MNADRLGLSLAALSAAAWSLAGVWIRLLPGVPVATVVAGRLALALVVVAPVALWRWRRLGRASGAVWGLAGLMVGYYVLAVAAFRLTGVAEGTLLINASPLFAVAWSVVRGEPVRRGERWGTALALAGVAVILAPGVLAGTEAGAERVVGDLIALGAALAMAVYSIVFARLQTAGRVPDPLLVTTLTFGLGAVAVTGMLAVSPSETLSGLDRPEAWGSLVGLALVTTAVPTFAYSVASSRLPPILATSARLLTPAFAAIAAWLVLAEAPSVWLIPGGALVLGGLVQSVRARE